MRRLDRTFDRDNSKMQETPKPNSSDLARKIIDLAEDKQASDITLLDLRQVSLLADYFVLCTSASDRQTQAILQAIAQDLKQEGILPYRPAEGSHDAGWTLLDYGDVVVHVFSAPTRAFYRLEELWKDAQVILKIK